MIGTSRGPKAIRAAVIASAIAGAVLLLFIGLAGAQPPAQSDRAGGTGSQDVGKADPPKAAEKAKAKAARAKGRTRRDPPGFYMGRPIADVMSWEGVDWLFRETRIEEEQPEAMLTALKIPRGATVADVGTGAGYHSIRLGRLVGPKGMVYATDVQTEMLRMLRENARAAGVANIKPVRCTQDDPGLPKAAIDLILMVDVYHECSDPEATLQGLRAALKPRGRLVLVEFRGEDPEVPIKPEHKMTLAQVRLEVEPQGFTFKESLEFLPWQHVIIFEKPAPSETKMPPDSKVDTKQTGSSGRESRTGR
jgi:ubiquinone/menaquinone biosynthesis C-methylase UbiE